MGLAELDRICSKRLIHMDGVTYGVIRTWPEGYLINLCYFGERVILSSEEDLDRFLKRMNRFVA